MAHRTTLLLDEKTRSAARELARRYGCSTSEAIRRAVVRHRDSVLGSSRQARAHRKRVLSKLFDLFADHDAAAELRRLKDEDRWF